MGKRGWLYTNGDKLGFLDATHYLDVVVIQVQVNSFLWEAQKELDQRLPERRTCLHQQALFCLQHQTAQHINKLRHCSRNLVEDANDSCYLLLILPIL